MTAVLGMGRSRKHERKEGEKGTRLELACGGGSDPSGVHQKSQEEGQEVGSNMKTVMSPIGHTLLPKISLNGAVSFEQSDSSRPGKTH